MKLITDTFDESSLQLVDVNGSLDKLESVQENVMNRSYDGGVLGKVKGIFCIKDSDSVNMRHYSAEFWEQVINSRLVQHRFATSSMIGTLEHPTRSKTKADYHEGIITGYHALNGGFVTKGVKFSGRNGYGDAYLLNTPVGNTILAYMLAKDDAGNNLFNIRPSSRGYSKKDYIINGRDMMNPDDYDLVAWDLVFNPGIRATTSEFEPRMKAESADGGLLGDIITTCNSHLCCMDIVRKSLKQNLNLKNI